MHANGKYNLPKGYSGTRTILRSYQFLKAPINFVSNNMDIYGDTYSAKLPGQKLILTRNGAFINHVLKDNHTNYGKSPFTADRLSQFLGKGMLFLNGSEWLTQRRLIQPGFHREKIQGLYSIIINVIDEYLSALPTGHNVDVYPLMHKLAFNVVIKSLFDIELSPQTMQMLVANFDVVQNFVIKDINQPFRRPFYPVTRAESKAVKKSDEIKAVFKSIIEERRKNGQAYNDLLDMLLQARYEDTGEPMKDGQLVDELLVFLFAGHETTANTLSWILYLLSTNPGVLQKIVEEARRVDVHGSVKSEYINAVINEGMRLYPAAWMTDRITLQDDSFSQYSFPKGTIIIPFFYGAHRNVDDWQNPGTFMPERFIAEDGRLKRFKNFFPFGAGPRMCIGNNFAMAEMCFFLHAFVQRFAITATGQIPKLKPLLTLRPDKVLLDIEKAVN